MLNIVIPMAGRGSRFSSAGYAVPKPLIEFGGRRMIDWVIDNVVPREPHRLIFLCLAEHLRLFPQLGEHLHRSGPDSVVIPVEQVTEGAACTVLLARHWINSDHPLMIANSDQFVDISIDAYLASMENRRADGLIMTFLNQDPKWSYCRMRPDGSVCEVVEKEVVSRHATVGIYNFRRGSDFVAGAEAMITKNLRVRGEFYVAPVYNELIARGSLVVVHDIGLEQKTMWGLGTPEDLERFRSSEVFRKLSLPETS